MKKPAKGLVEKLPAFYALIAECRPATIFGEQVASKDGREWLAGIRADLEGLGYAVGAADLCAASVGASHIRQRLFWVADRKCGRLESRHEQPRTPPTNLFTANSGDGLLANARCDSEEGLQPVGFPERGKTSTSGEREDFATQGNGFLSARSSESEFFFCQDGKWRRVPVEPALQPLADAGEMRGRSRVGVLRAAGNAIVVPLAVEFIKAYLGDGTIE